MTRTRLDSEERRKAIVEAAKPLFARNGFAGTTTRELARAAGVSEALLFQHFPSKAALYQEILGQGCRGEPGLATFTFVPPSTATLVRTIQLMLEHFVLGALGDPEGKDTRHRLMLQSFLDDGEYARLVGAWVVTEIHPEVRACIDAAAEAGDLRPGPLPSTNEFWFVHHIAAMIAYSRLPASGGAIPYHGDIQAVLRDAARFVLRGIGLTDEAITRHLDGPEALYPELAAVRVEHAAITGD